LRTEAPFRQRVPRLQENSSAEGAHFAPPLLGAFALIFSAPIDSFSGAELGPRQRGFSELVELVQSGKAYVKISGAYRVSKLAPDYADVVPLAKALIAANPERIVWGTDWPHPNSATPPGRNPTDVNPLFQIDDGRLLNQLPVWAPDPAIRKTILVHNPMRLYGW
jgi:predicted TIM-barrel fold metal-dependent hydrolase